MVYKRRFKNVIKPYSKTTTKHKPFRVAIFDFHLVYDIPTFLLLHCQHDCPSQDTDRRAKFHFVW